ncbi:hypothetical protein CBOM_04092 [Ceraceosorus bombacis]|uniref:Uncharacterized protein n=1 Tax=Ceraceosorus bombacis TaxID=401625 RepID=A0A0P1BMJ8_9BASI|nr:hypothetical protein CBOM_04092 [Ceraceosorus bombacis]
MTSLDTIAFPCDEVDNLRIQTLITTRRRSLSTSSTVSTDSETASPLPTPRQVPSSLRACPARAPCLKRNTSAPQPSIYSIKSISGAGQQPRTVAETDDGEDSGKSMGGVQRSRAGDLVLPSLPAVTTPLCSFAPPRSFCAAPPARTVRFCDSPPERGLTHSGKHYDRRPIKCTQGGSANDLSLHRTSTVGDGDEEEGANEEGEGIPMAQRSAGKTRWSGLKNGCVIGSALGADNAAASRMPEALSDPNVCKLPSHSVHSLGRLSNSGIGGLARTQPGGGNSDLLSHNADGEEEEDAEESSADDSEETATPTVRFSEVLAALKNSPDATPRQSPAVRIRWETCESYFSVPAINASSSDDETPQTMTAAVEAKHSGEECTPTTTSPSGNDSRAPSQQSGHPREASPRTSPLASPSAERREVVETPSAAPPRSSSTVRKSSLSPSAMETRHPQPPAVLASTASFAASLNALGLASPTDVSEGSTMSSSSSLSGSHGCFTMDSSPMSSRCSSVDPWSGISSDEMEGAHLDSPTGCGWGSSSCTSPDLCPVDVTKALAAHAQQSHRQDPSMTPQQRQMRRAGKRSSSPSPAASPSGGADRPVLPAVGDAPNSAVLDADRMHLGLHSASIRSRRAASRLSTEASSSASAKTSPVILPLLSISPIDSAPASPALEAQADAPLDERISPTKKERSTSRESGDGKPSGGARRKSSGAGGGPGTKTKKSGGRVSNGSAFSGDCSFGGDEGCLGGF